MSSAATHASNPRASACAIALSFLLLPAATGCAGGSATRFGEASAALRTCTDLELHEGLPHGMFEPAARAEELRTKATEMRHNQPFYVAPIPIGPQDVESIRGVLANASNFRDRDPDVGKLCGGFHADYAVTWSGGGSSYEMQLCFGCDEANLYAGADLFTFDIASRDGPVQRTLSRYRNQRPPVSR